MSSEFAKAIVKVVTKMQKRKREKPKKLAMTAQEYYRRKHDLELRQRTLDKEHLRAQFALNDEVLQLEREWDVIERKRQEIEDRKETVC